MRYNGSAIKFYSIRSSVLDLLITVKMAPLGQATPVMSKISLE